jgi:hypothetical protein
MLVQAPSVTAEVMHIWVTWLACMHIRRTQGMHCLSPDLHSCGAPVAQEVCWVLPGPHRTTDLIALIKCPPHHLVHIAGGQTADSAFDAALMSECLLQSSTVHVCEQSVSSLADHTCRPSVPVAPTTSTDCLLTCAPPIALAMPSMLRAGSSAAAAASAALTIRRWLRLVRAVQAA